MIMMMMMMMVMMVMVFQDFRLMPRSAALRKLNDLIKRARLARVGLCRLNLWYCCSCCCCCWRFYCCGCCCCCCFIVVVVVVVVGVFCCCGCSFYCCCCCCSPSPQSPLLLLSRCSPWSWASCTRRCRSSLARRRRRRVFSNTLSRPSRWVIFFIIMIIAGSSAWLNLNT